ncbi:Hsp70 protein-domain-containing protein [Pisolithus albus]|nr:Hsp70 protein-domain-containing protein [Pisolithus albus]
MRGGTPRCMCPSNVYALFMLSKFELPRAPSSVPAYTVPPTTDPDALKDKSQQMGEDVNDSRVIVDDPPPKAKAEPTSPARLPNGAPTTTPLPPPPSKPVSMSNKPKSAQKPKSMSRTLLPQGHNKQEASDSDTSSRVHPRTRSLVLRDSKIDKADMREIVLVGGSTHIPRIQKLVSDFFNGKEPHKGVNPEEAAAILSGETQDVLLFEVASFSLGIETVGGVMMPLVKRNPTLPTNKSEIFSTSSDDQYAVTIEAYTEVTFDIDANCVLNVSAFYKTTGKSNRISIPSETEEHYRTGDRAAAAPLQAKDDLESYA